MADYDYEVDVEPIHGSGARVAARLCNFVEGQTYMLQTHINWLRANVAHIVRSQKNSYVELFGFASKKGTPESNRVLSQGRCESVKNEVATYANQVNFKKNEGLGESASGGGEHDNWGFYRRVEIYVFAEKPPPGFKPTPPQLKPVIPGSRKPGSIKAPAGCWCITAVDTFGLPIKAGISAGTAAVTLLNDKGEVYVIKGIGAGAGLGVDIAPVEWAKKSGEVIKTLLNALKEIGLKAGDLQNISDKIKKLNLTGPSETVGAVFRRTVWKANLTIEEITSSGFFTISNGEVQAVFPGVEVGFIFFGKPPLDPFRSINEYAVSGSPWGFYQSMGIGNFKAGLGVGSTVYKTTSVQKQ